MGRADRAATAGRLLRETAGVSTGDQDANSRSIGGDRIIGGRQPLPRVPSQANGGEAMTDAERIGELEAELELVRGELQAVINDQCWIKKVRVDSLLPKDEFLKNCDAHYEFLQRGELPEVNLEAELVREALAAAERRIERLEGALRT